MNAKTIYLLLLVILSSSLLKSQNISWKNANVLSDKKPGWFIRFDTYSVINDQKGNSYCLGTYDDDDENYNYNVTPRQEKRSGTYISKVDKNGEIKWNVDVGTVYSLLVDENGNVYVTGISMEQNPVAGNKFKSQSFIGKLNDKGEIVWIHTVHDTAETFPYHLYLDEKKQIQIVYGAYTMQKAEKGWGVKTDRSDLTAELHIVIANIQENGELKNTRQLNNFRISKSCIERIYYYREQLYIAGNFYDTLKVSDTTLVPQRTNNAYIAIFGKEKFKKIIHFTRNEYDDKSYFQFPKLTFDKTGNIYIGGTYSTVAKFENFVLRGASKENGFIAKYNQSGKPEWAQSIGQALSAESCGATVAGIATDSIGNIWFTGSFCDELSLGKRRYLANKVSKPSEKDFSPSQIADIYLAYTDTKGNIIGSKIVTGVSDKVASDIYTNGSDLTLVGGFSNQTLYFDNNPTSTRGISIFIARLELKKIGNIQKTETKLIEKNKTSEAGVPDKLYTTKKFAVIIGISDYANETIEDLKFAEQDAKLFYDFLRSPEGGEVAEDQIELLLGANALRSAIISAMSRLFNLARQNDMIILYFASHGEVVPNTKELYLLPYEADPESLEGTSISEDDIKKYIERSNAGKKLIIADACHSGSLGLDKTMRSGKALRVNQKLLELATFRNGTAILSASSSTGVSLENSEKEQGEFTYYLVEGLKGKADKNMDRLVSIREIYNYVSQKVVTSTNGLQHPELKGIFSDDMPLGGIPEILQ